MTFQKSQAQRYLQAFDLDKLFREALGWDRYNTPLTVTVDGADYSLEPMAEKRGVVAFQCAAPQTPPYATRRKIETQAAKSFREHVIIFVDQGRSQQIWQWVRREPGRPLAGREHTYHRGQSGEPLLQRLAGIAFSLAEEEDLTLVDVTGRVRAAFNVERATKKFYDQFRRERDAFEKFLSGIPDDDLARWYVSVMLNRLMFIYFIEKKGFLDGDTNYLAHRLRWSQEGGPDRFYGDFLCPLFFAGFALPEQERPPEVQRLLGKVPYLNGGIFQPHELEQRHGQTIQMPDAAFSRLFAFFDQYQWHLDDRPLRDDREINPDVLGYIFEKYINQKQMGAYYTREDITGYISRNTILPFLFDQAKKACRVAFEGEGSVWSLAANDPDRYIYEAVRKGTELPLPAEIAAGIDAVSRRGLWNTPTPDDYALPTEIWRETVARRQRYEEVRAKLAGGDVRAINDFVTYNLDIQQFGQDVVETCEGADLLRAFWEAINQVSVLDPTCGSGAFLFAALNILEPLYEACIERMKAFMAEPEWVKLHPRYSELFGGVLEKMARHPNQTYFIYKSIVVNNLYGVDIMAEAVEIARLRLFLKLVAQVGEAEKIEPLPDIDFNIRAGNTLVGFTTKEEVEKAMRTAHSGQGKLVFGEDAAALRQIEEKAADVDRLFGRFRAMQTGLELQEYQPQDFTAAKEELKRRLKSLEEELNGYLARQYGVEPNRAAEYQKWLGSHQPFHWFVEFYGILRHGGFDVVIGNPPYVEYHKIRKTYSLPPGVYKTESAGNLYAYILERSLLLLNDPGRQGLIVPISLVCTQRMSTLQDLIFSRSNSTWHSNYAERPAKLFTGAEVLLTISLVDKNHQVRTHHWGTGLRKWSTLQRSTLFDVTSYSHIPGRLRTYIIPKLSSPLEPSIINKVWRGDEQLGASFRDPTANRLYYRIGGGRYWKIFTTFQPMFNLNGKPTASSRENHLYFSTPDERDITVAILSSSLFYWYFTLTTNGRDLNPSDLSGFPVDLSALSLQQRTELRQFSIMLMDDYQAKKKTKEKTSKLTGHIVYEEFYPRLSKEIIDQIDQTLGEFYGFTYDEVDFITNFEIKYRMGDELPGADEDEGG